MEECGFLRVPFTSECHFDYLRILFNRVTVVIDCHDFDGLGELTLSDAFRALLELTEQEKIERGVQFTPREIAQQPATWKTTYERCRDAASRLQAAIAAAGVGGSKPATVYLIGAGTSDYVGGALVALLHGRWGCDVSAVASTTLLTEFDQFHPAGRNYLWISISRSGDSPEGVALLTRALDQHPHIHHLVITCSQNGAMAKLCARHPERATALVLDDAVNDRGLAMTSSFTNMVLAGQCLANLGDLPRFGEAVARMTEIGSRFLSKVAEAAATITAQDCPRACFVGSGALRAAAQESSLKLVELSAGKVMTMSESALGLRHGPLSSVDGNCLFVAFLSNDPRRRGYEVDLLREIARKQLGRIRAVVTAEPSEEVSKLSEFCLSLDCGTDFPDEYRPVLDVILGQMLGLFASLRYGLKPDQPSPNGAISRVVMPIQLYS